MGFREQKTEDRGQKILSSVIRHLSSESGFSLIELMLTVSFVLLGCVLIQGAFMRAADMFGRYTHTLGIMAWAGQESAKAREMLLFSKDSSTSSQSGVVDLDGKSFEWTRDVQSLSGPNLYSVHVSARWTEGGRPFEFHNEIYGYKKDPSQSG